MSSVKKLLVVLVMFLTVTPLVANAAYVSTGRDTQENPETLTDIPAEDFDANGYAKLTENTNYVYYWKETLDILAVYDRRNGYTWKSGLDVTPSKTKITQDTVCDDALSEYEDGHGTYDDFKDLCEVDINTITGTTSGPLMANSLLYFEYYSKGAGDALWASDTVFSSYRKTALYTVVSTLQQVDGDPSHWRFTVEASELGVDKDLTLTILANLYLTEDGFEIRINNEDLSGTCLPYLSTIGLATYMGAVGGMDNVFTTWDVDGETPAGYDYQEVQKDLIGGYAFVPDGAGALIRFLDNTVSLTKYSATVYGTDLSQNMPNYRSWVGSYVPFKTASIPVYGIAHGNNQAAFVAYASSGDEYMTIVSTPEENIYKYNNTHAKFSYNFSYSKLYTLDGDNPVPSIWSELNDFDIDMHYDFLAGDGSTDGFPANYVGMALKYKAFLIEQTRLAYQAALNDEIGIRLDFMMADSADSIVGYTPQIATTASDVADILSDIKTTGITNISSGLIGWQKGGVTLGDPSKAVFSAAIGSKAAYRRLIAGFADQDIDISFYQDYYTINDKQINLYRNAAKHPAGWYTRLFTYESPIWTFYFARPIKSVQWLNNQSDTFIGLGTRSLTIDGMTSHLITDYTTEGTSRTEAVSMFRDAFSALSADQLINAANPNGFLFQYVDRYLQMDVYTTQYLIETDTVPFLQILLQGTMELYGIYSNFSFYTQQDILRMIDYNIYPSFVLTEKPAYVLTDTNSSEYYSTEYTLYKELIQTIYFQVNEALSPVIGAKWINREVVSLGVIRNTYDDGTEILINYTDHDVTVGTTTVEAASFAVIGGE